MRPMVIAAGFLLAVSFLTLPAMGQEMPSSSMQRAAQADLSAKVSRLEQLVASLQQQVALLQSVIRLSGNSVEITSNGDLKIKAARTVDVNAGSETRIKSAMTTNLLSGGNTIIKSSGLDMSSGFFRLTGGRGEISATSEMAIKGAILKLNRGTRPIATMGSMIAGNQVATGSPTILGE